MPGPQTPLPGQTTPASNGRRCRIVTNFGGQKTYLQANPNGSVASGVRMGAVAQPTEWILTPSGGNYSIRLANDAKYLASMPGVQLHSTPTKWMIKRVLEPLIPGMSDVKDQWTCSIHPANQPDVLLKSRHAAPILGGISTPLGDRQKWHILFIDNGDAALARLSSVKPAAKQVETPKTPSITLPPTVNTGRPLLSDESSFYTPASTVPDRNLVDGVTPTTPNPEKRSTLASERQESTTPSRDEVSSVSTLRNPPRANSMSTDTMSIPGSVGPSTPQFHSTIGAETPRQECSPRLKGDSLPTDDVLSQQSVQEPISRELSEFTAPVQEPHACSIQHILTGMYLTSVSSTVGLGVQLADAHVWSVRPAGPGYTLAMYELDAAAPVQYLAPKRDYTNGETNLCLSDYPAPWDLSPKQERYATTSMIGDAEWICKIRWPFTGDVIVAESARNRLGKEHDLVWLDQEMVDSIELHEFWRIQFFT